MINRQALNSYIKTLLNSSDFNDYAPNGLQIQGADKIEHFATAVTASLDAIEKAVELQTQALIVHHGFFWRGEAPEITGLKYARIKPLLEHSINLFAYHLPLDCHLELGNNACLGHLLQCHTIEPHSAGGVKNLLWSGELTHLQSDKEFLIRLEKLFNRMPLHVPAYNRPIKRIAWCSGGAQDYIESAFELGVDAYISGEISERTWHQAKEMGIHYFACGHHATERYGVRALGEHLANQFNLKHSFIDSDNQV